MFIAIEKKSELLDSIWFVGRRKVRSGDDGEMVMVVVHRTESRVSPTTWR